MKVNVGVDLERLRSPNSGLGQFCKYLAENLQKINQNNIDLHFYFPKNFIPSSLFLNQNTVNFSDKLLGVRNKSLQLFHCTHQDSHLFPKKITTILTIHDLNFLEKYSGKLKKKNKLQALQKRVKNASGITFISHYTQALAKEHLDIPDIPSKVIYNGNCLNTAIEPVKPASIGDVDFIFTIGIVNPKKNFHTLVSLVKNTKYQLLIAGNDSHEYASKIKHLANEMGVSERVIFLGQVTDAQKHWCYLNCKAFVFPSLAEGFGLPVIEAMSLGKPVFLSNRTSLPEVGGELAYYWNNFEANHMLEVFEQGMNDFQNSDGKSDELKKRAEKFNWQKTAQDYLNFYTEVYHTIL